MTKSKNKEQKVCAYCKSDFIASNSRQIYCKKSCKARAYELRKGQDSPEFLTNEDYELVSKEVSTKIENPLYIDAKKKIEHVEQKKVIKQGEIQKLETELSTILNDSNAALWGVGAGAGGWLLSQLFTDKTEIGLLFGAIGGLGAGAIRHNQHVNNPKVKQRIEKLKRELFVQKGQLKFTEKSIRMNTTAISLLPKFIEETEIKEIKIPKRKGLLNKKGSKSTFTSAADLRETSFDLYELKNRLGRFLGSIAKNSFITAFGKPGSGKSTFFLQLADFFTQYGIVLYVTPEEGISPTFQAKLKSNNISNEDIHITAFTKLSEIRSALKKYNYAFCFIDSINMIVDAEPDKLEKLRNDYSDTCFAMILQSTKDGKFKGSNEYAHNSDIHIKVTAGLAETEKNRFNQLSEYEVFTKL